MEHKTKLYLKLIITLGLMVIFFYLTVVSNTLTEYILWITLLAISSYYEGLIVRELVDHIKWEKKYKEVKQIINYKGK